MADRATLSTVAARAGVSPSTASLAFAGSPKVAPATLERVLRAADELGYAGPDPVAASLRTGRSGVVGAVVGERLLYAFRDPVAVQLLDGLTEELGKLGVGLLLLAGDSMRSGPTPGAARPAAAGRARCSRPAGWRTTRHSGCCRRGGCRWSPSRARCCPGCRWSASRTGTAPPRWPGTWPGSGTGTSRWSRCRCGWTTGAGRWTGPGWRPGSTGTPGSGCSGCARCSRPRRRWRPRRTRSRRASGPASPCSTGSPRPTAVVAQSDLLAAGVLRAAATRGLAVPEDVSVAGFDGADLPWLEPVRLTTVVQPTTEKGQAAGRAVAALLSGRVPEDVVLPVRLRVGDDDRPGSAGHVERLDRSASSGVARPRARRGPGRAPDRPVAAAVMTVILVALFVSPGASPRRVARRVRGASRRRVLARPGSRGRWPPAGRRGTSSRAAPPAPARHAATVRCGRSRACPAPGTGRARGWTSSGCGPRPRAPSTGSTSTTPARP